MSNPAELASAVEDLKMEVEGGSDDASQKGWEDWVARVEEKKVRITLFCRWRGG